jgi:hypothetical protein
MAENVRFAVVCADPPTLSQPRKADSRLSVARRTAGKRKVLYFSDGAPGSATIRWARIPRRGAGAVEQGCLLSICPTRNQQLGSSCITSQSRGGLGGIYPDRVGSPDKNPRPTCSGALQGGLPGPRPHKRSQPPKLPIGGSCNSFQANCYSKLPRVTSGYAPRRSHCLAARR